MSQPAPETPLGSYRAPASLPPESVDFDWRKNLLLFSATVLTVFAAGAMMVNRPGEDFALWRGWTFAVPLLLILLFHEFGHWIAARLHGVPASLPYFIPLPPQLFIFGTMGAVIMMPGRIRSRNALLDIGAAGPLAGMVIAIPALLIGLSTSELGPQVSGGIQEGQSLLYWFLKRLVFGPIPPGYDVYLNEVAFAGWAGLFITMLNLLPWGQLDGGHIAYALFGERQNTYALWVRRLLPVLFAYNLIQFVLPVVLGNSNLGYSVAIGNSLFWLLWFFITGGLGRMSGGANHPPFEPGELSRGRKIVAAFSLLLFILLFMPTPMAAH